MYIRYDAETNFLVVWKMNERGKGAHAKTERLFVKIYKNIE